MQKRLSQDRKPGQPLLHYQHNKQTGSALSSASTSRQPIQSLTFKTGNRFGFPPSPIRCQSTHYHCKNLQRFCSGAAIGLQWRCKRDAVGLQIICSDFAVTMQTLSAYSSRNPKLLLPFHCPLCRHLLPHTRKEEKNEDKAPFYCHSPR